MPSKKHVPHQGSKRAKLLLAAAAASTGAKKMVVTMANKKLTITESKPSEYTPAKHYLPSKFGKAEFKSDRPVQRYYYR